MPVGVNADFDYLLDPQQKRPMGFCVCCGREIYSLFVDTCDRCLFDVEVENE